MKLPTWIAIFLSPLGVVRAAKTWSTSSAVMLGIVVNAILFAAFWMHPIYGIGEPYFTTAEIFHEAATIAPRAVVFGFIFYAVIAAVIATDKSIVRSPMYRAVWLSGAPLLLPFSAWSILAVGHSTTDPGISMAKDQPDWVYSAYVQVFGSGQVWLVLVAYGIASLVYCILWTRDQHSDPETLP